MRSRKITERRARFCSLVSVWLLLAPSALAGGSAALAQATSPGKAPISRAVVQPLPSREVTALDSALQKLARNSRDLNALVEAGDAAIALGDLDAAAGFFGRAQELSPSNARAKLGLAEVYLRSQRPSLALPLLAEAESGGAPLADVLSERGLAYDLLGNSAGAEASYRRALALGKDPETTRRLALNRAIAGEEDGFEALLRPLLAKGDGAAYRSRAFGLAILGREAESRTIVESIMPRDLASALVPYLGFMPRLTKAQQAAAANLGIFPKAAQIGRDAPQIAARSRGAATKVGARLSPSGPPLGSESGKRAKKSVRNLAKLPRRRPDRTHSDAGQASPTPQSADETPKSPESAAPRVQKPSLADAFAGFSQLDTSERPAAASAVDISTIKIPREAAAPKPLKRKVKPAPPSYPSRIWVQLSIGSSKKAMRYDWRRFSRKAAGLLDRYSAHIAKWGQTNRLLAGPIKTRKQASSLVSKLKAKGLDSFRYTSPKGEKIDKLH